MSWNEYCRPTSLQEALDILSAYQGRARVIAGGTDLLLELRRGREEPECLVDITAIATLQQIELLDGRIIIGAAVTHSQTASSPLILKHAAALAQATGQMGSPQIRNQATVVGNVVQALPAADGAVALTAFEPEVEILSLEGSRWEPMEALYVDVGCCRVDCQREIVTRVRFRALGEGEGSAFQRLAKRNSLALPMLNVAAAVGLAGDRFDWVRIVLAPVAPRPYRVRSAEERLRGARVDGQNIALAAEMSEEQAQPRGSRLRGSAEYRRNMARVLTRRALEAAVSAARESHSDGCL